jgi:ubiquitin C-terminal hydrolase
MMLLICIPMMRNMDKAHRESAGTASRQEIVELREEVARLKAERALEDASETVDG